MSKLHEAIWAGGRRNDRWVECRNCRKILMPVPGAWIARDDGTTECYAPEPGNPRRGCTV